MTAYATERRAPVTRPSHPGGITAPCGCRYTRTGGWWYHVTPGHGHQLREWPVSDEHMVQALTPETSPREPAPGPTQQNRSHE